MDYRRWVRADGVVAVATYSASWPRPGHVQRLLATYSASWPRVYCRPVGGVGTRGAHNIPSMPAGQHEPHAPCTFQQSFPPSPTRSLHAVTLKALTHTRSWLSAPLTDLHQILALCPPH
ncbi:hypothetical protein ACOMHN_009597 [Nucella lapillus]